MIINYLFHRNTSNKKDCGRTILHDHNVFHFCDEPTPRNNGHLVIAVAVVTSIVVVVLVPFALASDNIVSIGKIVVVVAVVAVEFEHFDLVAAEPSTFDSDDGRD